MNSLVQAVAHVLRYPDAAGRRCPCGRKAHVVYDNFPMIIMALLLLAGLFFTVTILLSAFGIILIPFIVK